MSGTPRVSVLLPVYNAAETLREAIHSIRDQTFTDWELVVVNDGSTDCSGPLAEQLSYEDPRIRVVHTAHVGIVGTLNQGLSAARGDLIARMDADDLCHPQRLAEQVEWLDRNKNVGLVGCLVEFNGDPVLSKGYALHVTWINSLISADDIFLNRFVESPFAHPSVMFRREISVQLGGYRAGDFPEDYELWLRWMEAGVQMEKVPRTLLSWRDTPERLSRNDARYSPESFYTCKAQYLARWIQSHVAKNRSIIIWGAGRLTRRRAELLEQFGVTIGGYIDIDPRKIGRSHRGAQVVGPDDIPAPSDCFVLGYVSKWGARDFAHQHLIERGFIEGLHFLLAA